MLQTHQPRQTTAHDRTRPGSLAAFMVLTDAGVLLVLCSHRDISDAGAREELARKGYLRYLAFPVPLEEVQARYPSSYDVIARELSRRSGLRVVDFDSGRVVANTPFASLGAPIRVEP